MPGELDDALQLHLAPAAADVRRAERRDEAAGLGAEPLLALGDGAQLLADGGDRAAGAAPRAPSPGPRTGSSVSLIGASFASASSSSDDWLFSRASPVAALSRSSHWPWLCSDALIRLVGDAASCAVRPEIDDAGAEEEADRDEGECHRAEQR